MEQSFGRPKPFLIVPLVERLELEIFKTSPDNSIMAKYRLEFVIEMSFEVTENVHFLKRNSKEQFNELLTMIRCETEKFVSGSMFITKL